MESLRGKVALVIGGNSGLGRASAVALAAAGAKVMVAARRVPEGLAVVEQLQASGAEAAYFAVDVTDEEAISAAIARVTSAVGRNRSSTRVLTEVSISSQAPRDWLNLARSRVRPSLPTTWPTRCSSWAIF